MMCYATRLNNLNGINQLDFMAFGMHLKSPPSLKDLVAANATAYLSNSAS